MRKIALVTGSSRGIGKATALLASAEGYEVIVHGSKPSDELTEVANSIGAKLVYFDIADEAQVRKTIDNLTKNGKQIDVLVNSAGTLKPATVLESNYGDWLTHYGVNVMGIVNLVKATAPGMLKQGSGSIVNVASVRGHVSMASSRAAAYSASKAAVLNLTASLAKELSPTIRVNAVSPSFTLTSMSQHWSEAVWEQAHSNLLQRPAKPEEIAEAILFLASERASHITGQTLLIDGGYETSHK